MSAELLGTARRLAKASAKKPRQSDLKRAISTAYYALFHAVAQNNADLLVGTGSLRADKAWNQTYRALDHGAAKAACGQLRRLGFPAPISACGDAFVQLQQARHDSDYDPDHRVKRADALALIALAEEAVAALDQADRRISQGLRRSTPAQASLGGDLNCTAVASGDGAAIPTPRTPPPSPSSSRCR